MDDSILVSAAFILLRNRFNKTEKKKKRALWMRPFLSKRSTSENLTRELILDSYLFKNFTRMSKNDFEYLLNIIGPRIVKSDTNMRNAIPITTRLAITLRFLATGDSYRSLMYLFKVHFSSICLIVPEVCDALVDKLKELIKVSSKVFIEILVHVNHLQHLQQIHDMFVCFRLNFLYVPVRRQNK